MMDFADYARWLGGRCDHDEPRIDGHCEACGAPEEEIADEAASD